MQQPDTMMLSSGMLDPCHLLDTHITFALCLRNKRDHATCKDQR